MANSVHSSPNLVQNPERPPETSKSGPLGCFDCEVLGKITYVAVAALTIAFCFLIAPPALAIIFSIGAVGTLLTLRWLFCSDNTTATDCRNCCVISSGSSYRHSYRYDSTPGFVYGKPVTHTVHHHTSVFPTVQRMGSAPANARAHVGSSGLSGRPVQHSASYPTFGIGSSSRLSGAPSLFGGNRAQVGHR